MNPPDHARLRRLVSRAFTPARVKALTPHIETITRELLDGIDSEAGRSTSWRGSPSRCRCG